MPRWCGFPPESEKPCSTVFPWINLTLPGQTSCCSLSLSPEDASLLGISTVLIREVKSHLAQPLVSVGLSHHSKFLYHQLLRKVNFVELPKATLIFNYAISVGLPPGSCYAGSYCAALALNSLQIS